MWLYPTYRKRERLYSYWFRRVSLELNIKNTVVSEKYEISSTNFNKRMWLLFLIFIIITIIITIIIIIIIQRI